MDLNGASIFMKYHAVVAQYHYSWVICTFSPEMSDPES
jgi:hypothetical protein